MSARWKPSTIVYWFSADNFESVVLCIESKLFVGLSARIVWSHIANSGNEELTAAFRALSQKSRGKRNDIFTISNINYYVYTIRYYFQLEIACDILRFTKYSWNLYVLLFNMVVWSEHCLSFLLRGCFANWSCMLHCTHCNVSLFRSFRHIVGHYNASIFTVMFCFSCNHTEENEEGVNREGLLQACAIADALLVCVVSLCARVCNVHTTLSSYSFRTNELMKTSSLALTHSI